MLDWNNTINPMASAVKCAWRVTTVSHSYMDELKQSANGLENLFQYEMGKSHGILNGIDTPILSRTVSDFTARPEVASQW